jgi:hypothetical protein
MHKIKQLSLSTGTIDVKYNMIYLKQMIYIVTVQKETTHTILFGGYRHTSNIIIFI